MRRTPSATRRPSSTCAAIAKSSSVPLAQEPMKAWSILLPATSLIVDRVVDDAVGQRDQRLHVAELDGAALLVGRVLVGILRLERRGVALR